MIDWPILVALVAAAQPATQVVATFKEICVDNRSFADMKAAAARSGWAPVESSANDKIEQAAAKYEKRILLENGGTADFFALRRESGGRKLLLILTSSPFREGTPSRFVKCEVIDPTAAAPIEDAAARALSVQEPIIRDGGPSARWLEWRPGPMAPSSLLFVGFVRLEPSFVELASTEGVILGSHFLEEVR